MENNLTKNKNFLDLSPVEKIKFKKTVNPLLETLDNLSDIIQVHHMKSWKDLRYLFHSGYDYLGFADWTDEEFSGYDKETGFIGKKDGISCYAFEG